MVSQVTDQADHLVVCKRCHDKKDMAKVKHIKYQICWDCLFHMDLNNQNYQKYEKHSSE